MSFSYKAYDFNIKKYIGYEVKDNIELKLFFKDKKIESFDESLPVIKIAISYDKDGNVMGQLVK